MYYNLNDFFLDPIALKVGPIVVRWYALAYIAGLFLGWRYCALLLRRTPFVMEPQQLEDLLFYATIGVIIGGRLGYVLFYNPIYFFVIIKKIFTLSDFAPIFIAFKLIIKCAITSTWF